MRSEYRKIVVRLSYPECRFGKSVFLSSGVQIKVTDGGRISIGDGTTIKDNSIIIVKRGTLTVGRNSFIGWGAVICANEKIEIGDDALIAEYVTIRDQNHGIDAGSEVFRKQVMKTGPVVIHNNVWLGAKVTVLKGVTINKNSVVGANAVVHKDVDSNSIYAGVPAKQLRLIAEDD